MSESAAERETARKKKAAEKTARWRAAHPDQVRAYREQFKERAAAWREAHREEAAEYSRQWRRANPGDTRNRTTARDREYQRRYREAHAERIAAQVREWKAANPERLAQLRKENDLRRRALKAGSNAEGILAQLIAEKMTFYGNRCIYCGGPFEHVDHVKPLARSGQHLLAWLRPSCGPCNLRKGARWGGVAAWAATRQGDSHMHDKVAWTFPTWVAGVEVPASQRT